MVNIKVCSFVLLLVFIVNAQRPPTALPGLDMGLGYSFDVVEGLPPKFQIIPWTYEYQDQWYNPYDGNIYDVPDQINIVSNPRFVGVDSEYFFRSFSEYTKERAQSFGIDVGITGIAKVAFSQQKGLMTYNMRDLKKASALVLRDFKLYQLSLWPGELPNRHFKRAVDKLPDTYVQDEYVNFVRTWGTHVLVTMNLGASFNVTTFLNEEIVNTKSDKWVKNEISISFTYKLLEFGIKYSNFQADKKNTEEFLKNADVKTGAVGGNILLIEAKNYNEWVGSIADNPGPVKYTTTEIGNVVRDISTKNKSDLVKRAMRDYIAQVAASTPSRNLMETAEPTVPVEIKM